MKIGIMGAMPHEVNLIKSDMIAHKKEIIGGNEFCSGILHGFDSVVVFSKCGKAAASSTATTLFNIYNIDLLLFTGVAGAVDLALNVGDVVIGQHLYQYDIDASPMFPKFEIPLANKSKFSSEKKDVFLAETAINKYLKKIHAYIPENILKQFNIHAPKVVTGMIATGDQFVRDTLTHGNMHFSENEKAHAVEMEGAAVAQVCEDYNKPYLIIRTISDKADHSASIDFSAFIENVSNHYSSGIVFEFLTAFKESIAQAK